MHGVESFHKAWTIVKPFLANYGNMQKTFTVYNGYVIFAGRKRVPKELLMEIPDNPQEIPLTYLIPTTMGKGVCSFALVDFLVTAHNEFIYFYHDRIKIK